MQTTLINIYRIFIAFFLMTISGTIAAVLRIVSFGLLTDVNRKYIIPPSCKLTMALAGITLDNRLVLPELTKPHFITFNHNSRLDGFILISLGLTNTRYLLSEKMLWYVPLTITSFSIGVLYIPQKKHKERRLKFFKRLELRLKKEKVNLGGSSEGVHGLFNTIAEFNRGVYHTALVCNMPIVAIYIHTPVESNPFNDFRPIKKGTVRIELLDIIPTNDWTLENLDAHINDVRKLYVAKFNSYNQTTIV